MMRATFYVVVEAQTGRWSPRVTGIKARRVTQKKPSLASNEVAVRLTINLDEAVFEALLDAGEITVEAAEFPVSAEDAR